MILRPIAHRTVAQQETLTLIRARDVLVRFTNWCGELSAWIFYYGTDDLYLNYLARFVKPRGAIGIAGAGIMQEIDSSIPKHLRDWWTNDLWCLHSAPWWRRHWERTQIMDIEIADTMPDGCQLWLDWHRLIAPDNEAEIKALEGDRGEYLGYVRLEGRRTNAILPDQILSVPTQYIKKPLLRTAS